MLLFSFPHTTNPDLCDFRTPRGLHSVVFGILVTLLLMFLIAVPARAANTASSVKHPVSDPNANSAKRPSESAKAPAPDVWVDADPGCGGAFYADVDDCWAIFHAWAFADNRLAGISTVFGNVSGEEAYRSALNWMQRLAMAHPDRRWPRIVAGRLHPLTADAPARTGLTDGEAAMAAFLDQAESHSATLLMLGPVSNLAAVLRQNPARRNAIARVIMLGGQPPGMSHWLPVSGRMRMRDYNVIKDPLAMQVLLDAGLPIDFVPVQAAFGHWLSAESVRPLAVGHAALNWLVDESRAWERLWRWGFATPGYPPFDLLASALLFQPRRMQCEHVNATMRLFPFLTGKRTGLALQPLEGGAQAAAPLEQTATTVPTAQMAPVSPVYRRCKLADGNAVDLLRSALESVRRESH